MKMPILISVLVKEEKTAAKLKDSLTKFSICKQVLILADTEEALEYLNQGECVLLFIDEDYLNVLYTAHKPIFIVPICKKININRMRRMMKSGCFDVMVYEHMEDQLKAVLGKIIKIHTHYASRNKNQNTFSEKEADYGTSLARYIFTEESIFLPATKSEAAVRILLKEILYIKLLDNKIRFFMENGECFERRKSLRYFINKLPDHIFQKINQKTIVNVQKIDQIKRGDTCCIGDIHFKITRSFKAELKRKLPL